MSLSFYGTPPQEHPIARELRARGLLEVAERHAKSHQVTVSDILGTGRYRTIVRARWAVWREIRSTTDYSYPEIGRLFQVDPTTVMHACKGVVKVSPAGASAVLALMKVI